MVSGVTAELTGAEGLWLLGLLVLVEIGGVDIALSGGVGARYVTITGLLSGPLSPVMVYVLATSIFWPGVSVTGTVNVLSVAHGLEPANELLSIMATLTLGVMTGQVPLTVNAEPLVTSPLAGRLVITAGCVGIGAGLRAYTYSDRESAVTRAIHDKLKIAIPATPSTTARAL